MAGREALGLDDWMTHGGQRERAGYLSNWNKRPPKYKLHDVKHLLPGVDVVLSRRAGFTPVYWHNIPRIVVRDDGTRVVWGGRYGCPEDEQVLESQYFRDKETGERERPPERCGACKLIEWVYQAIDNGQLSWVDPVFEFKADRAAPKEQQTRVIHAGGICNLFGNKKLEKAQIKEMNEHGIYQTESFREVFWAKLNYVFCVVDNDAPKDGVQIAIEKASLGGRVKALIGEKRMKNEERGNPFKNPYVIRWLYDKEQNFDKCYRVLDMDELPLSPGVLELIDEEPPDTSHLTEFFNPIDLRARLEDAAVVDFPWDDLFGKLPAPARQAPRSQEVRGPDPDEDKKDKKDTDPAPPSDDEPVECDACKKDMKMSDKKCPHCGEVYEEEEPPPPPPPKRGRRGAKATGAPATGPSAKEAPKAAQAPQAGGMGSGGAFPDDDGDVPFLRPGLGAEAWWPR